ncbi:hypothetical protein C1H46_024318 [Malus baccata]|uniref:Uncharacterized protein n=1 Tax=Malus baccata TaxID=106549 RepID=A0A540LUI9_MALBA|nr:hypothetical protein C1H46_024318 [Malus baccata]
MNAASTTKNLEFQSFMLGEGVYGCSLKCFASTTFLFYWNKIQNSSFAFVIHSKYVAFGNILYSSLYLLSICRDVSQQVEAVIHFQDDSEELQQWDQQIVGLCQALNDVLDSMAKKGMAIPV